MNSLSKTSLLTEIMANHELLDAIGPAWRLYLRLVLIDGGRLLGTYEEIAEKLSVNGRTIRNWVKQLTAGEIISCQNKGRQVNITLLEPHKTIALAPEQAPAATQNIVADDHELQKILTLYQAAKETQTPIQLNTTANILWKK